jgi:predicted dehydrogenase
VEQYGQKYARSRSHVLADAHAATPLPPSLPTLCSCSPDLALATAITAPGGAAEGPVRCATLDELLACTDVEIVLNLTPVHHHAEVSRAALLAGKHVWSEKPLAQTQQDALELVALAHQRGLELVFSPRSSRQGGRRAALHQLRALHLLKN